MKNLKDYVKDELAKYILVNCIVLLLISGNLKIDTVHVVDVVDLLGGKMFNAAVTVYIMYIYTFILNSMMSDSFRKTLVWFLSPMPGEIVFEEIGEDSKDKRFTSEKARQIFSEIYSAMEDISDESEDIDFSD